ncbi:MAG: hypothetical protein KME10_28025 [Plectolyngbya sp. WJT66-NPBG17]|jgi:hypothetical protein|nr:hypothetical protein [Plectolyngbya sp. WJT66-NPBG17]
MKKSLTCFALETVLTTLKTSLEEAKELVCFDIIELKDSLPPPILNRCLELISNIPEHNLEKTSPNYCEFEMLLEGKPYQKFILFRDRSCFIVDANRR